MSQQTGLGEELHAQAQEYRQGNPRPLGGYVLVMTIFATVVALTGVIAAWSGRGLPRRIAPYDLALITAGTHKLSRTISKDAVTSPLRAPFTRYRGTGGPAEVMEDTRDTGTVRHAIGELLSCPFCLDMWIATGLVIGLLFAPRFTRVVAATFTALAGADFLQLIYARAQQAVQG
ncbi:MAG TPA: DUF1360 domain-containing protein [Pseudonocardiaceae bacterium]|nr:DUF1360 domain-containing protein [Pseudonocardiaceae bacterium]